MPKSKPKPETPETPEINRRELLAGAALMRDAKFRRWLVEDPRAAAASIGIKLSNAEVTMIQNKDLKKLNRMALSFQRFAGTGATPGPAWG